MTESNINCPKIIIEYLYLDLNSCDRCIGTDNVLNEVLITLTPALKLAGYTVQFKKIEIEDIKMAEHYRFLSSPTIRVNGMDIFQSVEENSCGCCSNISGNEVYCRTFEFNGKIYEIPPKEMLAEAILRAVFGQVQYCQCGNYELPENLRDFFNGKEDKKGDLVL